eukprot:COSAG06_NODE_4286_length_4399_cov_3.887907_6_plen_185_part_00
MLPSRAMRSLVVLVLVACSVAAAVFFPVRGALHCTAQCTSLHFTALHCTSLHCTAPWAPAAGPCALGHAAAAGCRSVRTTAQPCSAPARAIWARGHRGMLPWSCSCLAARVAVGLGLVTGRTGRLRRDCLALLWWHWPPRHVVHPTSVGPLAARSGADRKLARGRGNLVRRAVDAPTALESVHC